MVSTAAFGVCAMRRILRVSHTFEHTFWIGVSFPNQRIFLPVPESTYEERYGVIESLDSYRVIWYDYTDS